MSVMLEIPESVTKLEPRRVGAVLRAIREHQGLTQQEVGERLGMSTGGYGHYEGGRARLVVSDLPRFAIALGITVEELIEAFGLYESPEEPTIEVIVRSIRGTGDLSEDDKDFLIRLVERSRRIIRGEPDPGP